MSYTLEEVSERTGKTQENLRKLIQRGRLRAEKEGVRTFVSQEALEDFVGSELMDDAADEVRVGNHDAAGVLLAQLPKRIKQAISMASITASRPPMDNTLPLGKGQKVLLKPNLGVSTFGSSKPAPKPGKKK